MRRHSSTIGVDTGKVNTVRSWSWLRHSTDLHPAWALRAPASPTRDTVLPGPSAPACPRRDVLGLWRTWWFSLVRLRSWSKAGLGQGPLPCWIPKGIKGRRVGFPGGIRSKRQLRRSGVSSARVRGSTRTKRVRPWGHFAPFRLTQLNTHWRSNSGRNPAESCPFAGYQPYWF